MTTFQTVMVIMANLGLGALTAEALRGWRQRRKMGADVAETLTRSAVLLLEPLHKRIGQLETDLGAAESRAAQLDRLLLVARAEIADLSADLHQAQQEVTDLRTRLGADQPKEPG